MTPLFVLLDALMVLSCFSSRQPMTVVELFECQYLLHEIP
jgi:hypothetical protein